MEKCKKLPAHTPDQAHEAGRLDMAVLLARAEADFRLQIEAAEQRAARPERSEDAQRAVCPPPLLTGGESPRNPTER